MVRSRISSAAAKIVPEDETLDHSSQGPEMIDLGDSQSLRERFRQYLGNFSIIALAVLLILLLRSCLLGYFFPGSGIGEKLATLSYLFNGVVHRNAGEASFQKANLDQVLFENDALRTYANSHAEVTFIGGGQIKVDENTLIVLRNYRDGFFGGANHFALFLEQGHALFNLKPNEEIVQFVKTPYGEIKIRAKAGKNGARFSVELLPDGKTKITLYSGDGEVEINGQVFQLKQNEFILIDENLKATVMLLPRSKILLTPTQDPIIFTRKVGQEVTFEWDKRENVESYGFELSQDEEFKSTVNQSATPNTFFTDRILGAGRYFWRIRPSSQTNPASEIRGTFLMVYDDPNAWDKVILDPQRNVVDDADEKTTIYFQADYPLVTFSWKAVKGAVSYRLEIFKDRDFQELVVAQDLAETQFSTKPGFFRDVEYYWQVIAHDGRRRPIHVTDVFELGLIYDNALAYLTIYEPDEGTIYRDTLASPVSGALPKNASLFIEGDAYSVDRRGKFSGSIKVPKGTSQIVFKAISEEDRIEYHARTITVF